MLPVYNEVLLCKYFSIHCENNQFLKKLVLIIICMAGLNCRVSFATKRLSLSNKNIIIPPTRLSEGSFLQDLRKKPLNVIYYHTLEIMKAIKYIRALRQQIFGDRKNDAFLKI